MELKVSSQGPYVKILQERIGILDPDGDFGPITEGKLKEWQRKNGFKETGIADLEILKKMNIIFLKLENLKGHIPDHILDQIPDASSRFGITSNLRLAHLLAQASHESGNFKSTVENLNYSSDGLKKIFPKYFPGKLNESYSRQPERIANRVYGGRMGNGNEASGDGWKYRGRGLLQTTGKSNYLDFDKIVPENILENPDLLSTKYALASAAFFFQKNNLWTICDKGFSKDVVTLVSKRVNGGTIGLEHRIKEFDKFWNLLK